MSELRKQRRAMRRKIAMKGLTNETVDKIAATVDENTANKVIAEMLIAMAGFMHIERGHTGAWLKKWLRDFLDFTDAINDFGYGGKGIKEVADILLTECKFDMAKEYKAASGLSNLK